MAVVRAYFGTACQPRTWGYNWHLTAVLLGAGRLLRCRRPVPGLIYVDSGGLAVEWLANNNYSEVWSVCLLPLIKLCKRASPLRHQS